jgi:hypothetical protein
MFSETISPAVMLSPNAMNVVALSLGGAITVTVNGQLTATFFKSVAVHVTSVVPILNTESLAG